MSSEGYSVRAARKDRDERHGKTYEEARELRCQAAKDASICGECFQPLAASDSVTMEGRKVGKDYWVRVPVCLLCSLGGIHHVHYPRGSGMEDYYWAPNWRRTRCLGCGRLLRIRVTSWHGALRRSQCFCCDDCKRAVRNERNNLRRRVKHEARICENPKCPRCGRPFIPKRDDARTCSNACRQALHRARRALGCVR